MLFKRYCTCKYRCGKNDIELLRVFKMSIIGHKEWINGVYWSKYITCFSVFGQQPCPVCLSEKITCQIVVVLAGMYCWATVAQISLTDVSPLVFVFIFIFLFFRGGSVCLSWLLEPSLPIKGKALILLFCFDMMWRYHESVMWFIGTATPKRCLLLYISSGLLSLSAFMFYFFFPLGDTFWCTWLACFTFLWLLFGNKILWKATLCHSGDIVQCVCCDW